LKNFGAFDRIVLHDRAAQEPTAAGGRHGVRSSARESASRTRKLVGLQLGFGGLAEVRPKKVTYDGGMRYPAD
jgi:hypothetical protein